MRLTTLVQAATGFRHASHSFRALTPIAYRSLFYPSGPPPSPASSSDAEFPFEPRSHLSAGQFESVRNAGGRPIFDKKDFQDLVPEEKPQMTLLGNTTPAEVWAQSSSRFADSQRQAPGIHRGRTVPVRSVEELGQQYAKLQSILRYNNVRKELRLTERHEKKGAKRRRLCSERWRRKFADEVRKKVKLVTEIRLRDRMWGAKY